MKKPLLNEEITKIRKMMGLNESENPYYSSDPSDGDRDAEIETTGQAYALYDKGLEAYSEGDFLKAERYYNDALKVGSYLGWDEQELPPYEKAVKGIGEGTGEDEIVESEISEGSMESGVYYDTTVAHEIKSKVGNLHKIAPYVLEIGDRVIEDISGKISVYDEGNLVEKFDNVEAFLIGIKYGATPV